MFLQIWLDPDPGSRNLVDPKHNIRNVSKTICTFLIWKLHMYSGVLRGKDFSNFRYVHEFGSRPCAYC